jgi:hypothetical protein
MRLKLILFLLSKLLVRIVDIFLLYQECPVDHVSSPLLYDIIEVCWLDFAENTLEIF